MECGSPVAECFNSFYSLPQRLRLYHGAAKIFLRTHSRTHPIPRKDFHATQARHDFVVTTRDCVR